MTDGAAIAWLREQIEGDLGQARFAMSAENVSAQWTEVSSGVLHTGPGTEADCWDGTWAMGDSRLTRFIARHDPRNVVADCEAKLAILGAEQTQYWTITVLARAYKHRDGYEKHWGTP